MTDTRASEHTSVLGRWRSVKRQADPRLRDYVVGYFASESFLPAPLRERHLPAGEIALVLNFASPHRRLEPEARSVALHDEAWIVGLHDTFQLTEAFGERAFMVVRFTPIGARLFLRTPMVLVANSAIDIAQMDLRLAQLLRDRVFSQTGWRARFSAMEGLIAERMAPSPEASSVLCAWNRIKLSHGQIGLGALADELALSHRALIAQFRSYVGLPPKTVARVHRFNRAVAMLNRARLGTAGEPAGKPFVEASGPQDWVEGVISWAQLAADCGFFDQSHLIRDFRAFTGLSPGAFLRRTIAA